MNVNQSEGREGGASHYESLSRCRVGGPTCTYVLQPGCGRDSHTKKGPCLEPHSQSILPDNNYLLNVAREALVIEIVTDGGKKLVFRM